MLRTQSPVVLDFKDSSWLAEENEPGTMRQKFDYFLNRLVADNQALLLMLLFGTLVVFFGLVYQFFIASKDGQDRVTQLSDGSLADGFWLVVRSSLVLACFMFRVSFLV